MRKKRIRLQKRINISWLRKFFFPFHPEGSIGSSLHIISCLNVCVCSFEKAAPAVSSYSAVSFIAAIAASLSLSCSKFAGWDSPTLVFCTRGIVAGVEVITTGLRRRMRLSVILSLSLLRVMGRQNGGGMAPLEIKH